MEVRGELHGRGRALGGDLALHFQVTLHDHLRSGRDLDVTVGLEQNLGASIRTVAPDDRLAWCAALRPRIAIREADSDSVVSVPADAQHNAFRSRERVVRD